MRYSVIYLCTHFYVPLGYACPRQKLKASSGLRVPKGHGGKNIFFTKQLE